jgi:hypothetical protein
MSNYTNTDLLPLNITESPWLFETNIKNKQYIDNGKWMLFYDKTLINEKWALAVKLYRESNLTGVHTMKCATAFEKPCQSIDQGIIVLYCENSGDKENIINIGKNILDQFKYTEKLKIYYKTDLQTKVGTRETGIRVNHLYNLINPHYKAKEIPKPIIERHYPAKKSIIEYPKRYTKDNFAEFNEINNNIKLQEDYKKWNNGINYLTNRKIKIGARTHRKIETIFIRLIQTKHLSSINENDYLHETVEIKHKIDAENIAIKEYNKPIDSIILKINELESWVDFVRFNDINYGLLKVVDGYHRENDCFGIVKLGETKGRECGACRMSYPTNNCDCVYYATYKCDKCGYI